MNINTEIEMQEMDSVNLDEIENSSSMYVEAMDQLKEKFENHEKLARKMKREYKHILKQVINICGYVEKLDTIIKQDCETPEVITLTEFLYNDYHDLLDHLLFKSSQLMCENKDK